MLSERLRYLWYEFLSYPTALFAAFGVSLRTKGSRHVPRHGGLLVVANHQSYLDPPLVGVAVRRHLSYLARHSLFRNRLFSWWIKSVGAVPINQEMGTEGIKTTLALLKAGKAVLIFPEGSRTEDGTMQPLKPGIVILIRRAGVPILPVGIAGAYDVWPIHQKSPRLAPVFSSRGCGIAVVVGKPLDTKALADLPPNDILAMCNQSLRDLHAEAERLRRGSRSE